MKTLLKINLQDLTLNQKINERQKLSQDYGQGDLFLLRGQKVFYIEQDARDYGVFSKDPEYIADALYYGQNEPKQFYRAEGEWVERDLDLRVDYNSYYDMIEVDNCWCFLNIYIDALSVLDELKDKELIKDRLLRSLR